ncbi:hypothetical protein ISS05_01390 [Candidatus Woesearchaeota archaeon]|nr:hypothetical protein [Candidatus Woesearchaeota archaeon]
MSKKKEVSVKYEFHKWKKKLLYIDIILSVVVVISLGVFKPDLVVIAAFFLIIPYLLLTQRKALLYHLIVAFFIALLWMLIAKNEYSYNSGFITIAGFSLYPLFSWTLGLFGLYFIYSHYEHKLKKQKFIQKLGLFILFYWPLLIIAESVAYHIFNIKNIAAAAYSGLPFCDCIHAPLWMQISYFSLGIIFFLACYKLGLENPHFRAV